MMKCGWRVCRVPCSVADLQKISPPHNEKKPTVTGEPFLFKCLAMTYSHMGRPHTTIGDDAFHF